MKTLTRIPSQRFCLSCSPSDKKEMTKFYKIVWLVKYVGPKKIIV